MPTPRDARRRRPQSVERVLREHRIRRHSATEVLEILRQTPVHVAPGTEAAATARTRLLTDRLRLVNRQIRERHQRLDAICAELPGPASEEDDRPEGCEQRDVEILRGFPGVGRILLATLLAEAARPLASRDHRALRSLTGVAPVTRRSGKRCSVGMRQACHGRLRRALNHGARVAAQCDEIWRQRDTVSRDRLALRAAAGWPLSQCRSPSLVFSIWLSGSLEFVWSYRETRFAGRRRILRRSARRGGRSGRADLTSGPSPASR